MSGTSGTLPGGTVHETRALGAQVLRWQPAGHEPVLFAGGRLPDVAPAHMGIPVVLPWFAAGPSGDRTPSHGYGRLATWTRGDAVETDRSISLTYLLDHRTASRTDGFDPAFGLLDAVLEVTLGDVLEIALAVTNVGSQPTGVELALHTYLRVGDVEQVRLTGLEDADFLDRTAPDGPVRREAEGRPLQLRGEVDRVYLSTSAVHVDDPVLGRVLAVTKDGSGTTVVWNPGPTKGEELVDLAPGEWRELVCVEAAAVGEHAVALAPGATHVLSTRIAVAPRADRTTQQED